MTGRKASVENAHPEHRHRTAFCAGCGQGFDPDLAKCPHCGSKQRVRKGALLCEGR